MRSARKLWALGAMNRLQLKNRGLAVMCMQVHGVFRCMREACGVHDTPTTK